MSDWHRPAWVYTWTFEFGGEVQVGPQGIIDEGMCVTFSGNGLVEL